MELVLGTLAFSFGSALLPFLNVEAYLAVIAAAGDAGPFRLAVVAAAGQTLGKIIWYEIASRGVDSEWAQRKLSQPKVQASYDKWSVRLQDRPWYGAVIVFLSSSAGFSPLLVLAAVAGALKVPRWVFIPTVFVGRALRFWVILAGVEWFFI